MATLKEDDVELELGLSLSIERSYKKAPLNDVKTGFEPVFLALAGESAQRGLDAQMEVDARAKRETQALRRQEAKRKREEKRLVKLGGNGALSKGDEKHPAKTMKTLIIRPVAGYINGGDRRSVHDGQDSEREESSGKGGSCGSPAVTSSACSDHRRRTSREGGNSSDMKSHISQPGLDQRPSNGSKATDVKGDCKCSASPGQALYAAANGGADNSPSLDRPSKDTNPESAPESPRNQVSVSANPIPGGTRQTNGDRGRPPKPQTQSNAASALSSMPCVSTTGNGPNGKTVSGFLYRYETTEEVSIICICHGTSFSPAEFVQHAGGTDVSNPLRHITMVASAF